MKNLFSHPILCCLTLLMAGEERGKGKLKVNVSRTGINKTLQASGEFEVIKGNQSIEGEIRVLKVNLVDARGLKNPIY